MTDAARNQSVLGVILAGGLNRRYGGRHKALELVGGEPIAARAVRAMSGAADRVVMVANDPAAFQDMGLAIRPDLRPGLGALGGIYTAVAWALEEGYRGALVAACDMPFLSSGLLSRLKESAGPGGIVVPTSDSRRGLEPLCAFYGVDCLSAIEAALERGDRHVISFYPDVQVRKIPSDEVGAFGDPSLLFLNVNTPEDRDRAEEALLRIETSTG